MGKDGRIPGRSVRVEDELWHQVQEAARWRGDKVSTVIRRGLVAYVRTTNKLRQDADSDDTHEERTHDDSKQRGPRSRRQGG